MAKRILSKILKIVTTPAKNVEGAAAIIAASILLSRILGLVRYRLLAAYFGDEITLLDSFLSASAVPEIIFEVLIFGSISVAFIPVFTSLLAKNQKSAAWKLAKTLVNLGLIVFVILAIVLFLVAQKIGFLVAPGLISENPELGLTIGNLIRVMIVAQAFFLIGIFATGILQSYQNFLIPAVAPAVYNLGIIFGIIALSPRFGIYGPAFGMIIGAAAFCFVQLIVITRLGSIFGIQIDFRQPNVTNVIKLTWPRMVGLTAARGVDWINIALASLTGAGSIVAFNFAQTLAAVPVGLFGASVAQAALPTLANQFARKNLENFKKTLVSSLHQIIFLTLPAISLLSILRIPAIRLVFGAANFPWETTLLAGKILIILSIAIASQASLLLLIRAFYALGDAKTPIVCGLISFFINVVLAILAIPILKLPVTFLAGAFTFTSILYSAILVFFLDKKIGGFNWQELLTPAAKMFLAAILAAVITYFPFKILDFILDTSRTVNVIILTAVSGFTGLLMYFGLNLIAGVNEAKRLSIFFKNLKFPKKILTTETFKA